jgi:hypothetical protein
VAAARTAELDQTATAAAARAAEARAEAAELALEAKRRRLAPAEDEDEDEDEALDPRHMLIGLTMPEAPAWDEAHGAAGPVAGELREDWIAFIRALWARGATVADFIALTGWTRSRAYALWAEARGVVAREIDPGDVLEARREVDAQAQAIGRLAWRYAQAPKLGPRDRAALLKVALDAGKARADALGLGKLTVELAGSAKVEVDFMADIRARFGIDEAALEAVGAALAQEMSVAQRLAMGRVRGASQITTDPAPTRLLEVLEVVAEDEKADT